MKGNKLLLLACVIWLCSGCSKKIGDLSIIHHGGRLAQKIPANDSVKIKFLGVACFLFEFNGRSVLTDPFISNPPMRKVLFGKIKTDTALVNKYVSEQDLANVNIVAAGHAHYDHLMDLPYMAAKIPASAKFCGSQTMKHTLAPAGLSQALLPMNGLAADSVRAGQWIYSADSTIRLMAALSTHPPHFLNVILHEGPYTEDLDEIPTKTRHWKCGQTLSYLIDFLDDDKTTIGYRIFFQSSGSEPKNGFFPEAIIGERTADAAVFGIANDHKQRKYPYEAIDLMEPDVVFLAHWENFMRAKEKPYKAVQTGNPEKFYHAIKSAYPDKEIILPAPGSYYSVAGMND